MAVVAFGVFVAADDLMVVATMLRPMIDDFGLIVPDDLDAAAWIVNTYLVAYVAVMPVAGRLSDLFGRRAVYVAAMALFALGSLIVPAADGLATLYLGRVLTAVGGGALVPVAFAVAADLHRGAERARALGLLAAIETVGWVWGPLYGAILVRFLTWRWQFHLNVVLATAAIVVALRVLPAGVAGASAARRRLTDVDWFGPLALTGALVAFSLALLGGARVQTVSGLDQLTDSGRGWAGPWLYPIGLVALGLFAWRERRTASPLVDPALRGDRPALAALAVNLLVSVGLVVTLINVPLFVNIVEGGVTDSAVRAGWLLTAFTATMAATSYLGGVLTGSRGARLPTAAGLAVAGVGLTTMGVVWEPATSPVAMATHLAVAGAGIGLVLAPTSAAVIDAVDDDARGLASGLVIVARLIGFSIGLAALTAWGLRRYDTLRTGVELPALTDPGYADAVADATRDVSTTALAETFIGGAIAVVVALAVARLLAPGPARQAQDRTTA
ncbi:MAG: MFS transporter [Actinomycetota bacterium]